MDTRKVEAANYHTALHASLAELEPAAWNALLAAQAQPTPFMRHEYLSVLSESGCASTRTGWQPGALALRNAQGELVGAVALYFKTHSWGEYVFDHAWAQAYARHGLSYYPKLLVAVPFTPVPGSRLLARDAPARLALLHALRELAQAQNLSSAHLLYLDETEQAAAAQAGWMLRAGVQFHWQNRHKTQAGSAPYASFDEFLADLQREKRKKIAQERRKVAQAGVSFEVREAGQITLADWEFFHHCYSLTYRAHHSTPYLTRAAFAQLHAALPQHWLLFIASTGSGAQRQRVAASLVAIDRAQGAAWGRYWGATQAVDCLHFEACYYQPLQWCIEQGFARFEGGAQGEHKMARGLLPAPTASAHWLAHPQFAQAVEDFLSREGAGMEEYLSELRERSPFKAGCVVPT